MERMWRKVNHSFTGRTSKSTATIQSTDTTSSAGFGEGQIVVAVANNNNNSNSNSAGTGNLPSSTATGRRLAASGVQSQTVITPNQQKSLSQHVLLNSTASSERRRRRRRKSRPRRSGDMSSGGFGHHQIMESTNQQHHHHHQQLYQPLQPHDQEPVPPLPPPQPQQQQQQQQSTSSSALMMGVSSSGNACYPPIVAPNNQQPDVSLRQRAVAKLRMFNFHLNWDLHMTQCKPCGPRSGGGNIITRRLCRNRRREDNELYRSNSFKFERFERKECNEEFADTLQKKISICDDYSLPIDFVKKRPSSFDPCLAEAIPNPETWVAPSPLSDLVNFIEPPSAGLGATVVSGAAVAAAAAATTTTTSAPPPPPPPTSSSAGNVNTSSSTHQLQSHQPSQHRSHHHPPLPNTIKQASVKLIEGYSDPKDTKRPKKVYHKKSKPRKEHKRSNYSSDSSAPKSSADEDTNSVKAPELNSPDSISEDLVRPLPPLHRSPRKLTTLSSDATANSKRNPSPYYYSDLLKTKDTDKETKQKSRQSTASEPPQLTQQPVVAGAYRKSTSLDVPEVDREQPEGASEIPQQLTPKRYSFTEEGVRIIRCTTPSTSTSDDSDCSECQKRREWHARALALVRQTCNIQSVSGLGDKVELQLQPNQFIPLESELQSMPPHRLLGPAVCACAAPTIGDDLDEYFRPRSIFYVHAQGVHECADCSASTNSVNNLPDEQQLPAEQEQEDEGEMSGGRTRQFYETAFDCKITKSDDDLDEVDRITNHSVLLQIENGNNVIPKPKPPSERKTRLEGKRLKNSKNQAIQDKTNASATTAASGTANSSSTVGSGGAIAGSVSALSNDLENVHIDHNTSVDQMNNTTSNSQLPMRGYTPSPPSTAPLPMKFPSKHDRFFMNSIKSAPNLPSSNPAAHPRLKDLRLPIQSHHRAMHAAASIDSQNSSFAEKSRTRPERPRSFVLESGRVLELRKSGASSGHHHHVGHAQASSNNSSPANGRRHQHNYSSTESIATSSSGGSMESLRSSTSEGNRSTSSSGSRHSTSLSSHSSESGSSLAFPLRAPIVIHSKLHILSPISDKSSQEPASDTSEFQKNASPEEQKAALLVDNNQQAVPEVLLKKQRRPPPNKTLLHLADEILGSDSGISLHSRGEDGKKSGLHKFTLPKLNFPSSEKTDSGIGPISGLGLPQDLRDLPFDMPKLRRRKTLQQDTCTSGSATSVDLGDLPFDMPKLRRRLRMNQTDMTNLLVHSTESSGISQASSSHSMRDENKALKLETAIFRQNLTLNLNEPVRSTTKFGSLDLRGIPSNKELNLNLITGFTSAVDLIDISVPLERQGWYHGAITRIEAETTLRPLSEGSFLVRNCESTKQDYSLSLKGAKGFMHMRIQRNDSGQYILGQFSRPFDSVPEMIRHFCLNRLPVRGAEHMCLIDPVIAQLL
ncbi:uncharacterized protein LOC129943135 isoform X2 [Eupeodes corollae]|uniref:uncharacterized protein LOC129943135 isoform X2 n=1 Tax=Eupeodes corollae TaxID=290404 RepID=UPI00248FA26A|nr:uncharacterized protein LOC129943135 isoform X2 [Eupeodes corollae]